MVEEQIKKLLRRKPMTAKQLAAKLGVSKVTVYRAINRMRPEDMELEWAQADEKRRGPKAWKYRVD